ncbi:MAG TPA: MFS transporter, partial [Leptospiraceae bacterium]|nr:MFS transporter [Leptospiraceae bacterium]
MIEALKAFIRPAPEMPRIQDPTRIKSDYRYWRTRIMYSMMSGYAVYYFVRKNFSIANKSISEEFHFSNTEMGLILSAATVAYGISKFASGILVDILNPRFLMSAGLILSALTNIFFGMGAGLTVFIVLWALNNLFQGLGMPPCGKLLNSWFSRKEGGRAWGLWNASHQIGGGLIFLIAGFLVSEYGWRSSFYVPGVFAI